MREALAKRNVRIGIGVGAVVVVSLGLWLVFGYFGFHKAFIDDEVDETLTTFVDDTAPTGDTAAEDGADTSTTGPATPGTLQLPVRLATASFVGVEGHDVSGDVNLVRNPDGSHVLQFPDLNSENGPDLVVWLSAGGSTDDIHDLGSLKGNLGSQQYEIPTDVDIADYDTVLIWCERFSVGFGEAVLAPA